MTSGALTSGYESNPLSARPRSSPFGNRQERKAPGTVLALLPIRVSTNSYQRRRPRFHGGRPYVPHHPETRRYRRATGELSGLQEQLFRYAECSFARLGVSGWCPKKWHINVRVTTDPETAVVAQPVQLTSSGPQRTVPRNLHAQAPPGQAAVSGATCRVYRLLLPTTPKCPVKLHQALVFGAARFREGEFRGKE